MAKMQFRLGGEAACAACVLFAAACGNVTAATPTMDAAPADSGGGAGGDASVADAISAPMIDAALPHKVIFVTSQAFTGNLGGVAGADVKCQSLAQAAKLTGTFKAWLGNSTTTADSRTTHATVPYTLVNGVVVANNYAGLISGHLLNGINVTELNTQSLGGTATECFFGGTGKFAWTNANPDGSIANTNAVNSCGSDWNDVGPSTAGGPFGVVGVIGQVDGSWTVACASAECETTAPLYCIEQ